MVDASLIPVPIQHIQKTEKYLLKENSIPVIEQNPNNLDCLNKDALILFATKVA